MPKKLDVETAKTASMLEMSYEDTEELLEEEEDGTPMEKMLKKEIASAPVKLKVVKEHVIEELLLQGKKKYGKGRIYRLGEREDIEMPRIPTGIDDLDSVIGGGLPLGKIIEVFGEESTGKSSLMAHLIPRVPQVLYVDAERTLDEDRLEELGLVDSKNLVLANPDTAEATLELIWTWAKAGVALIILDSLMAMTPKAVLENENFEKSDSMALIPRLLSSKLPIINAACADSGTIFIIVNQMRSKVGMVFGNPLDSPGGHALKHFASLRIQTGRKGVLEDDKIGEYGQYTAIRIVKSKVSKPRGRAVLPFIYDRGFVTPEEVPDILDSLREAAGFRKKRKRVVAGEEEGEEDVA